MRDIKIEKLHIDHFRGISNDLDLSFNVTGQAESALIFGDNGSGKSSIVDAIEFITSGTIQGNKSTKAGGWLYNSVSLENKEKANIVIELMNHNPISALFERNIEEQKVEGEWSTIKEFRYAPFILRRMDILNFWSQQTQQKLMLFFKYVDTESEETLFADDEEVQMIERQRIDKKNEKRELIETICSFYKLNADGLLTKNKGDFFKYIKPFNNGKNLKQLSNRHPQHDNLVKLAKIYDEIGSLKRKYKETLKSKNEIISSTYKGDKKEKLQRIMLEISPAVTSAFKKISRTSDYVEEIDIRVANLSEMSLEFMVKLENGSKMQPQMLFSEANRDLLSLLLYFEFIYYSRKFGQAKVLVLDDIFQSVDSTIRFKVMQYLIERFKDWQIIITTHDRLWKEQLIQLFRNHGKELQQFEIMNWSFHEGPRVVGSKNNFDEKLLNSIENGSTADICASAGYLLEYMCEKLSCILSTNIKRRAGDRYTIGDLWPGIYKELKKSQGKETFGELNDLLYLRNMVGSHYNEWSLSLSRTEANDFAKVVLDAYYLVCSKDSGKWIRNIGEIVTAAFPVD